MSNFRVLGRKCAATVATVATLVAARVATLFPRSSNTVATLFSPMVRRISLSKTAFYSRLSSNSSNTFPNPSQENAFEGERYFYDEYDLDDYSDWLREDEWNDVGWPEWAKEGGSDLPPWLKTPGKGDSIWERAIDEIIDNEEPGQYPPGNQSGEDRFLF